MRWTERRRMAISGGLTVLAAALALWAHKPWSGWAALAMAVSTVGDGLLAGYPACFRPVKNKLIKGGAVFFAAHCLYILALIKASGENVKALLPLLLIPGLVFASFTVLHGSLLYFHAGSRPSLGFFAAAMGYLLTAGLHAALAVCVCARGGGRLSLNAAGAMLFYLSDFVLLARKLGDVGGKYTTDLIWLTYIPAQLCLMAGFFLA